jgi:hypothetical protein
MFRNVSQINLFLLLEAKNRHFPKLLINNSKYKVLFKTQNTPYKNFHTFL